MVRDTNKQLNTEFRAEKELSVVTLKICVIQQYLNIVDAIHGKRMSG